MNMSCLQPFLVLSLAAMSRKKEKEDVDMEEEEEEEEEWEVDEPWRNSKGRKTGGAPPLGLGKPEELPSKPRGW